MYIEKLTKKQVKEVYAEHLRTDFPPSETKPLSAILRAMNKGIYECLGLIEDGELLCYAFLVKHGENYLLDYLATVSGRRGTGVGSVMLGALAEHIGGGTCLIAEVEDPELADSPEEKNIRTRRLRFYLRNGFADTGIRANTFGVGFIIIEMLRDKAHSAEQIREIYRDCYRMMLPGIIYRKAVRILG